MATQFRKFIDGIRVVPKSTLTTELQKGDLQAKDDAAGKLYYYNGASESPILTERHTATLQYKTIDSNDNNTISVGLSSLKTAVGDGNKVIRRDAAGAVVSGNLVPNTSEIVTLDASQSFTNKTFDAEGTGNSLTNIKDSNIKVGANISRAKLASGTLNTVVVNDGAGVMSTLALASAQIILGNSGGIPTATSITGEVTITSTGATTVGTMANVATSGKLSTQVESVAVASTVTVSKSFVRLTSGTGTTIDGITAGLDGQHLVISNLTGANVTITNQSSSASDAIITGTGEDVLLEPNASLFLVYDATLSNSKWMVVGGSGGGSESVINGTAGEAITTGDPVYLSNPDNKFFKVDAASDSKIEYIGVSLDTVASDGSPRIQTSGEVTIPSASIIGGAFTIGKPVYINPLLPGKYTSTVPTSATQWIIQAGIATSAVKMVINGAGSATAVKITSETDQFVYANVTSVSSTQTLSNGNSIVLATGGVGGITLTLPSPTAGKIFNIKKVDAGVGTITISPPSVTPPSPPIGIDGAASKVITSQYDSLTITSDGTNFFII